MTPTETDASPSPRALSILDIRALPLGAPVLLHVGPPEGLAGTDTWTIAIALPFPALNDLKSLLFHNLRIWPDGDGLVDELLRQLGDLDKTLQPDMSRVLVPDFIDPRIGRRPAAVLDRYGLPFFQDLLDAARPYRPQGSSPYRYSQAELLRAKFVPLRFCIEGLVPAEGLGVLGGRPKIGKSWASLQMAGCVASGTPFLGRAASQGPVLALMLEDTARRLKDRLIAQRANRDSPIHYILRFEKLDRGGVRSLEQEIDAHRPKLVLIDTIATAMSGAFVENDAGPVGAVFNPLRELAQDRHVMILAIMHHGKTVQKDAGMDIRGSSAFAGAADGILGIYGEESGYVLRASGRDIEQQELRVAFDAGRTFCWHLVGDARDVARAEAEAGILEALDARGGRADINCIVDDTGKDRTTVQKHVKRMFEEGHLGREPDRSGFVYFRPTVSEIASGNGRTPPTPRTLSASPVGGVRGVRRSGESAEGNAWEVPSGTVPATP